MTSKLKLCFLFLILFFFISTPIFSQNNQVIDPWKNIDEISESIGEFKFLDKTYNIIDFGAKPDGTTNNSDAIKKAIEVCTKNGGGTVIIPLGKFLCGPIHLENNVNLHLEDGSELLFSSNPDDYYPLVLTSFEGNQLMNYSPLIYAYKKKNIAITGKGTLNGQANNTNWWPWCGKSTYGWEQGKPCQNDEQNRLRLIKLAEDHVPFEQRVFGNDHYLRPTFIEPFECEKVLIHGVSIINAPFWLIHPMKSIYVVIDSVTVNSHGPNNDGCDPEYSKNVIIKNSTFNTGDDCIAIKSGRDAEGRRIAIKSENIVVQNCKMIDGHGGVVIGSEVSAGVSNVYVENCSMNSPELERAIRIKTNSKRGGITENVYVRNLNIGTVKEAVLLIDMHYASYPNETGAFMPIIRNIQLENIKAKNGGKYGIYADGYKESPIKNVILKNVIIEKINQDIKLENIEEFKFIATYVNSKLLKSP